ncbi:MAG TPA: hypothetical protein VFK76_03755 [Gaiellaceae bacterium]|nr:hypothetical protein [Gaiellaceae bacterium]
MDTPSNPVGDRRARGRVLGWVALCLAAAAVAIVAGGAWALTRGGSGSSGLSAGAIEPSGPPSVLTKGFVGLPLAGHDRDVLVGIGARPRESVDVVVIPSDETDVAPSDVTLMRSGTRLSGSDAASCGSRCLRFPLRVLAGAPSRFVVTVDRPGKPTATVRFALPARLPPSADRPYRTARARMLALGSLTMHETLGSGLAPPVVSTWTFGAPDRLIYDIVGGSKAVVIGTTRWDWADGKWTRSTSSRLRLPAYPWQGVTGARLVGSARVDGRPVRVLAALKPGAEFPTWFLLYVTPGGDVLRMRMSTTGHFMVDTYGDLDAAPPIWPPA